MSNARGRVAHFHLTERIHEGEWADVFEARSARSGGVVHKVAVKVLRPQHACIGERLRAFLREVQLVTRVTHAGFAQVLEAGEHQGQYYIATELIDGWTIAELVKELTARRVALPITALLGIVSELTEAIGHLHTQLDEKIIHRGLHPRNIMIQRTGRVVVLDLGEAAYGDEQLEPVRAADDVRDYCAPEILEGAVGDPSSDVYSVGALLSRLAEHLDAGTRNGAQDIAALVDRARQSKPRHRFAAMSDLRSAIAAVARSRGIQISRDATTTFLVSFHGQDQKPRDPRAGRRAATAAPIHMPKCDLATAIADDMDAFDLVATRLGAKTPARPSTDAPREAVALPQSRARTMARTVRRPSAPPVARPASVPPPDVGHATADMSKSALELADEERSRPRPQQRAINTPLPEDRYDEAAHLAQTVIPPQDDRLAGLEDERPRRFAASSSSNLKTTAGLVPESSSSRPKWPEENVVTLPYGKPPRVAWPSQTRETVLPGQRQTHRMDEESSE